MDTISDQCSWYRGAGPLNALVKTVPDVQVEYHTKIASHDWQLFTDKDLMFVLRPWNERHYAAMLTAKAVGLKIWADFDDDFSVPNECSWFRDVGVDFEVVKKCLTLVDHLTVSTQAAYDVYSQHFKGPITIIPNGYDLSSFADVELGAVREKTIAWRGSETHDEDWAEVAASYVPLMQANPEWTTCFYWGLPKHISFYVNHQHKRYSIPVFHRALAEGNHKILVAPLRATQFNRSKSNAAWLEGTMAGCLVLGRDIPEWRSKPNCFIYSNLNEFACVLEDLMDVDTSIAKEHVRSGQEYIKTHLALDQLNLARLDVIQSLS